MRQKTDARTGRLDLLAPILDGTFYDVLSHEFDDERTASGEYILLTSTEMQQHAATLGALIDHGLLSRTAALGAIADIYGIADTDGERARIGPAVPGDGHDRQRVLDHPGSAGSRTLR